ncbi:MAG: nucleotide sugar dehydrogenase [Planctomycetota bacterium]|nr:MAG: nucleotide sugar dehydrogenase [Planctomycetota bacterium]REK22363.1 MAG: nucleotide sugar dehydrogenase [Planctomycetota bacterium]REK43590.1 MAG: nucleotide sugar dehydrogenase [Planctomycetota bacterium]
MKRVALFGTGYVGCVTGACMARDGHQVIGVDIDADKVAALNAGQAPVAEPGLGEMVQEQVASGRLRATEDFRAAIAETDMAMIAVGTPSDRTGAVSTAAVEKVIQSIGEALRGSDQNYNVVVRSTLLPGILEDRLAPLLAAASERELGGSLRLCNNPEFLRESIAIRDYDFPPYVVVGTLDGGEADDVLELYSTIDADKFVTDTRTAALLKYGCNAYHALKVAFANEMGSLAKTFGADGQQVMDMLCRDTKLNVSKAYLRPGFAFGGSCLPKDVRALTRYAEEQAVRVSLLGAIMPSNQEHLERAIRMVEESGQKQVGMVGLSFKAGTDDLRESPYVTLVETLVGRGYDIKIYDPGISISRLTGRNLAYVDQHLPHLAALLVEETSELFDHASLLILGNDIADEIEIPSRFDDNLIDLRRSLVVADQPGAAVS